MLRLIELEKSVVEGAGAAPLAAFLAGKLDALKGRDVVLVAVRRQHRPDDPRSRDRSRASSPMAGCRASPCRSAIGPGGLARLSEVIASTGASIKEIVHDRAFSGPDLSEVRVVCVVETTGHEHVEVLAQALADAGIRVVG